jgi:hypothetical protein
VSFNFLQYLLKCVCGMECLIWLPVKIEFVNLCEWITGAYQSIQNCVRSGCRGLNSGPTSNGSVSRSFSRVPWYFYQGGSSHYGAIAKGDIYSASPIFGTLYRAYESCEYALVHCLFLDECVVLSANTVFLRIQYTSFSIIYFPSFSHWKKCLKKIQVCW